jgi:hypothetical protein
VYLVRCGCSDTAGHKVFTSQPRNSSHSREPSIGCYAMLPGLGDFDWTAGEVHEEQERPPDPQEEDALAALRDVFAKQRARVFFGRQLAVQREDRWFHWTTHRALARLEEEGFIKGEVRPLKYSDEVHLMWHRSYRYPRRQADRIVEIIESYSDPLMSRAIGRQGEWLVLEGFMRRQFVLVERAATPIGSESGPRAITTSTSSLNATAWPTASSQEHTCLHGP